MSLHYAKCQTVNSTQTPQLTLSRPELFALACSVGLVPLNSTMIAVAIPAIATDLAVLPAQLVQWLVSSYLLVSIVAQSPAGKLGDRWGHGRMLRWGQLIFAAGSVAGYLAHAMPVLAVARILMALGGAIMVPGAMATLRTSLPEAQRAKAFGAFGSVMALSAAIGPLVGGEIAARFGWDALFLVNIVPLGLVAATAAYKRPGVPRPLVDRPKSRFDLLGSALLAIGLAMLVTAARNIQDAFPLVIVGVGALFVFVWWELRTEDPVIDLKLFTRRAFTAGACIVGLQNFAMYALLFELPLVFSQSFQATPAESGRALLALTLAMVVGSTVGGHTAARLGFRRAAIIGTTVALTGGILLWLNPLVSVASSFLTLLALGLGLGLSTPAANSASMSAVRGSESGMGSAVSGTLRYLGGVAGVAMVSALATTDVLLHALQLSSVVFVFALALALVLACSIPKSR